MLFFKVHRRVGNGGCTVQAEQRQAAEEVSSHLILSHLILLGEKIRGTRNTVTKADFFFTCTPDGLNSVTLFGMFTLAVMKKK